MADWIEPIFDRTESDVEFAKEQIAKWSKLSLNTLQTTRELKGCLNVSDINRIEGDIQYLSDILDEYGYNPHVPCKVWERSGLPTERDVRRILSNIKLLISSYHQIPDSPGVPSEMARYTDINAIEENLYNIKLLLDAMVNSFPISGAIKSGGLRMPRRR